MPYDLNGLKRRDFSFPTNPADRVLEVRASALKLSLVGSAKKRITFEATDSKAPREAVYDLMETALHGRRLPLSMVNVSSAVIKVVFENTDGHGRPTKILAFRVSYPNSCNLEDSPEELVAKKYLIERPPGSPVRAYIHFQKRGWDPDHDERGQNIMWTFLQVLCRVDVKRHPDRLVQKVYNDTVHHLHDEYRRSWNRMNREFTADPEEIDALAGGVEGIDFAAIELREAQEIEIQRLREHLDAGRITEADFLLLIGTRVYGKSVADYARETGLDYQVAKKRRQRAEAVIRRFEKEKR